MGAAAVTRAGIDVGVGCALTLDGGARCSGGQQGGLTPIYRFVDKTTCL
jgi:hypothetical protein